jgi:hypothetical protein
MAKISISPGKITRIVQKVTITLPSEKPGLEILSEKDYTVSTTSAVKGTDIFSLSANGSKVYLRRAGEPGIGLLDRITAGYKAIKNAVKTGGRTYDEVRSINSAINDYNAAVEHYDAVKDTRAITTTEEETLSASKVFAGSLEKRL